MIAGNNGILAKTVEAKESTEFSRILEEINLARINTINIEEKDVSNLDSFEDLGYSLPEKYQDKLLLRNGDVYVAYNADENIKREAKKRGILTYYVNDNSLKCLSTNKGKIIYDENNTRYFWEDESGNNNTYKIANYTEDCWKDGLQLKINTEPDKSTFCYSNECSAAKTAIITISNFDINKKYMLFAGTSNNYYSTFKVNTNSVEIAYKRISKFVSFIYSNI